MPSMSIISSAVASSDEPLEYRSPVRYKEDDVTIGEGLDYNGYMYTEYEIVQEIEKPE